MVCRHPKGDPNCSSTPGSASFWEYGEGAQRLRQEKQRKNKTPNKGQFEIEDAFESAQHLVLQVKYPSCADCAFEGTKVIVFVARLIDAIKWKEIDPHFRDDSEEMQSKKAPSPIARFPGNKFEEACNYVAWLEAN